MKVLIVDDDLTSRIALSGVLSQFGDVREAADGPAGVQAHHDALDRGEPFDLISIDIMMPGMNGLEALQHIRREEEQRGICRPEGAKVIMVTAREDSESISEAFERLCDAYIRKPIDGNDVVDIVTCICPVG